MNEQDVRQLLIEFVRERNWEQFHTPENLAKSIAIESAELLECFQWSDEYDESSVREELADVLTYAYLLAMKLQAEPSELIAEKLTVTRAKYPVHLSRGKSTKYDAF